jgi:hypothetical protein
MLAVDIVLLPNPSMVDFCIRLNRSLAADDIILHRRDFVPHISLCMGVVKKDCLDSLCDMVIAVSREFHRFSLTADSIHIGGLPDGRVVSGLQVAKTPDLQALHEKIMWSSQMFLSRDAAFDMLYPESAHNQFTLDWIRNFVRNSSFEKFNPHITIGIGGLPKADLPRKFNAGIIAVCHLGDYCSCRKILFQYRLG